MELRKKNLHMMQKKSEAQNQITFDEDYNVPDQKADIGQIIQKKGEVEIEQVQERRKSCDSGTVDLPAFVCGRQSGKNSFQSGRKASDRRNIASG